MNKSNYQYSRVKAMAIERKREGYSWWPLFALMGILAGLLLWETLNPLPLIVAELVSFAALWLVFFGVALWLIFLMRK